jgi:hypothetical protein
METWNFLLHGAPWNVKSWYLSAGYTCVIVCSTPKPESSPHAIEAFVQFVHFI